MASPSNASEAGDPADLLAALSLDAPPPPPGLLALPVELFGLIAGRYLDDASLNRLGRSCRAAFAVMLRALRWRAVVVRDFDGSLLDAQVASPREELYAENLRSLAFKLDGDLERSWDGEKAWFDAFPDELARYLEFYRKAERLEITAEDSLVLAQGGASTPCFPLLINALGSGLGENLTSLTLNVLDLSETFVEESHLVALYGGPPPPRAFRSFGAGLASACPRLSTLMLSSTLVGAGTAAYHLSPLFSRLAKTLRHVLFDGVSVRAPPRTASAEDNTVPPHLRDPFAEFSDPPPGQYPPLETGFLAFPPDERPDLSALRTLNISILRPGGTPPGERAVGLSPADLESLAACGPSQLGELVLSDWGGQLVRRPGSADADPSGLQALAAATPALKTLTVRWMCDPFAPDPMPYAFLPPLFARRWTALRHLSMFQDGAGWLDRPAGEPALRERDLVAWDDGGVFSSLGAQTLPRLRTLRISGGFVRASSVQATVREVWGGLLVPPEAARGLDALELTDVRVKVRGEEGYELLTEPNEPEGTRGEVRVDCYVPLSCRNGVSLGGEE